MNAIACLLIALSCGSAPQGDGPPKVRPTGTFLQWYLAEKWGDAEWQAEFRAMREAGMDIMILTPAVQVKSFEAFYATRIPGLKRAAGFPDVFELCLRNAEKANVRVFVGMTANEDWWQKGASDPVWLNGQMDLGDKVADDLYELYKRRFPHAFYGWYWDWEADNENFNTPPRREALGDAIHRTLRHLDRLDHGMPFMMCPFMNVHSGTAQAYGLFWRQVFERAEFRKGDIFCPQDSVGAGGATLETFAPFFAEFQRAVQGTPGLELWSDMETFNEDETASPLDRVSRQLAAVQPYVRGVVTFAYSHFYSPVTANAGWQRAYKTMVERGSAAFPKAAPPAPGDLICGREGDGKKALLTWSASPDNGYEVLLNGKVIGRIGPPKASRAPGAHETFTVDEAKAGDRYEIRSYDFYGNRSKAQEVGSAP